MKKFFSLLVITIIITMLFTSINVFASDSDVEITFCVGDSTLIINGVPHTVETPYVVGDGVTLVPVRVITEAFGATVDWDHDTKTVTLNYPGVNISLQINNPVADVNGMAQKLLSVPELTNTSTMVPLRFISENFGADVSYDPVTEKITVSKKVSTDGSTVISGGVDSTYIGDSYYNWMIEKPNDMQMDYRSFDGTYTSFMYDEDNYIYIDIYPLSKDYDFEEDYAAAKESMKGLTLIKAEKNSTSNYKKIHVAAKNQLNYYDEQKIITDKYEIYICGTFKNENSAQRDGWLETLKTFSVPYNNNDTYDLSNIKNGMRTYTAEDLNLTFSVPQEFYMTSSEYAVNELDFMSFLPEDDFSFMSVNVYSKSDVGSAKELAEHDYNLNKENYNPSIVILSSGVTTRQYNTIKAYEYSYDYKSSAETGYFRDVFFEKGEYVYNFAVSVKSTLGDMNVFADKVINSIKAEPIDASVVGVLLRNIEDTNGTYVSKVGDISLTIPKIYEESTSSNEAIYSNTANGTTIIFTYNKFANTDYNEAKEFVKTYENEYKSKEEYTIISSTSDVTIGDIKYAKLITREKVDRGYTYYHMYIGVKNKGMYIFITMYPEFAYYDKSIKETEDIIQSIK